MKLIHSTNSHLSKYCKVIMSLQQVVDMWIEEYKSNRESALVQLMQFFINASGCRGKVTPDMAQMDHTLIIKKMTQEFDEVGVIKSSFESMLRFCCLTRYYERLGLTFF